MHLKNRFHRVFLIITLTGLVTLNLRQACPRGCGYVNQRFVDGLVELHDIPDKH